MAISRRALMLVAVSIATSAWSQTTNPTTPPSQGQSLGVDTTLTDYASAQAAYNNEVSGRLAAAKAGMATNDPATTEIIIDPYKKDPNTGQYLLDANGNKIPKTQAEIDAELAAAKAKQASLAPPDTTRPPGVLPYDPNLPSGQWPVVVYIPISTNTYTWGYNDGKWADDVRAPGSAVKAPVEIAHADTTVVQREAWVETTSMGSVIHDDGTMEVVNVPSDSVLATSAAVFTGATPVSLAFVSDYKQPVIAYDVPRCPCCGEPIDTVWTEVLYDWVPNQTIYVAVNEADNFSGRRCHNGGCQWDQGSHVVEIEYIEGEKTCNGPVVYKGRESRGEAYWDDCTNSYMLVVDYESDVFMGSPANNSEGPPMPTNLPVYTSGDRNYGTCGFYSEWSGWYKGKVTCTAWMPVATETFKGCVNHHKEGAPCPTK